MRLCILGGLLIGLVACTAPAPVRQPSDTVATDSTVDSTEALRGLSPRTIAPNVTSGIDSVKYGDTLRLTYWRTVVIVDSTKIQKPPAPIVLYGIPLGASGSEPGDLPSYLQAGMLGVTSKSILKELAEAKTAKAKCVILNMTGGAHTRYMTDGVFDMKKWQDTMALYGTTEIKSGVASYVKDGTVCGNSVMDEPNNAGEGDGNTWGPKGTMTKARVDTMARYVKNMFPTLAVGVAHQHNIFDTKSTYKQVDFIVTQYASRLGTLSTWIASALSTGKADGVQMVLAMNVLNGGTQASGGKDGPWKCSTAGRGTYSPNCRMTPGNVKSYGSQLVVKTTGQLVMWRYDSAYFAKQENLDAMKAVVDVGNQVKFVPLKRR